MSILELTTASGEALPITRFRAKEHVSAPFAIDLWALCDDASLDLAAVAGRPATFRAVAGHVHALAAGGRSWSGVICHAEQVHAVPSGLGQVGVSTYLFRLVPELWLLSRRRDNRIFQQRAIPDIVEEILRGSSIRHEWRIDRPRYPKLEYKVQYAETDLAFVSRLLEEAGIAFTFAADAKGGTMLTLSDRLEGGPLRGGPPLPYVDSPNEASEEELVTKVGYYREVRPGAVTLRDYDPRHPALPLFARSPLVAGEDRYEQYHHDAGAFLVETGKPEGTPVADDRGLARHDPAYGQALVERMLHGERVGVRSIEFDSNAYDLAPGTVFAIANHPHDDLPAARKLLVLETRLEGDEQGAWSLSVVSVPADVPHRPPRRTQKPVIHGVQSARVVGPPGQEIHTDEYGRVRVELPWDRAGHRDQRSSCWVRVAQGWGGMGYGWINLPRIGQEVLVSFLEGDPDQPVIAGRAFNAIEQVPYRLPEHKTRSTWKSDSSPGSGGFNEVMFEDLAGRELVWQQAQKDRVREVKNDEYATVGHDRQKLVKHDETDNTDGHRKRWVGKDADGVVKQDRRERIEHDSHLEVRGNRGDLVRGDESLTVVGAQDERVSGRHALRANKQVHGVAEEIVGEGGDAVMLRGPGGFVRIDEAGVTIVGTLVKINVSGKPGSGPGCKPAPPEEPELGKTPSITKLRWSKPKVPVGDPVDAIFRIKHFKGSETALVRVFEHDADGSKKQIDEVSVPVGKTDGDVKVKWARTPEQAEGDLQEDAEADDIGALEYRFEVEAGGLRSEKPSGPLWLTNTVVVEVVEGDKPGKDGTKVTLETVEGKKVKTAKGGKAVFEDVVVGKLKIRTKPPKNG